MQINRLAKYNFVESCLKEFMLKRVDLAHLCELVRTIRSLHLEDEAAEETDEILNDWYGSIFDKLSDYQPAPITFHFDRVKSSWQSVCDLLDAGEQRGCEAFVAFHLVGAILQRSFSAIDLADLHLGRRGDFFVGNTVFHVSVPPRPALYEKCKRNLRDGLRVYLLVRNKVVVGTK